jgi:hypothetical protein
MTSISNTTFIVKHDYHKTIKQYAKVKIITIINNFCLIEDIETLERLWIAKYDIYPINNTFLNGWWEKDTYYDNLYKEMGFIE